MATVFPATLTFYTGVTGASQIRGVNVTGENVYVTVDPPPSTGPFTWNPSPTGGWLLNPPKPRRDGSGTQAGPAITKPPMVIPVTFTQPPSTAPVHTTMTVNIQRNDATRSAIPGFPAKLALEGNAGGGVGPGMVKILRVVANPAGPDLAGEFVEIINPTDATIDLAGCTVGDRRGRGGLRALHSFASSFTLDPVSSAGPRRLLRIFTGPGVPTDPAFVQVPLNRGAPVWNNVGDTAWIKNSLGQLLDVYVYPAGPNPTQFTPARSPVTAVVVVPPTSVLAPGTVPALVPTPISVEEGDRLMFAAAGEIWVGHGIGSGRSGPEGKSTEAAGDGYPAPNAPPISLIGTIGSMGQFFLIGSATTHLVDDAEGTLFLGVNDANLGDNWGSGYTCVITRFRP